MTCPTGLHGRAVYFLKIGYDGNAAAGRGKTDCFSARFLILLLLGIDKRLADRAGRKEL
jgi:hypothetical protein